MDSDRLEKVFLHKIIWPTIVGFFEDNVKDTPR